MRMTEPLDADSFRRLVEAYAAPLTRYASGFLGGDADDARDIVQDAFIRLWQNPPADWSHPRAWLYAVCRTRAIDLLRRRGRIVSDDGAIAESTVDEAPTPARTLLEKESASALFALVDTLPARQREIVRLKFQGDLSYAEIAEVTGLTATNVGFILHSALTKLRELAGKRADLKP
jgi:RNA polymerase sigma factor (sigma-70 family)